MLLSSEIQTNNHSFLYKPMESLLVERGPDNICEWAAKNGRLDVLSYTREHGCPWNEWTCTWAAVNGHLDCLSYAREHGCPWDVWTCAHAAENGHLNCLSYAREHGCPWDEWTCVYAAEIGHLHVLLWALQHNCPLPTQPITIQFHQKYFTSTNKLLLNVNRYNLKFKNKQLVEVWIQNVDDLCSDLCYNDLSVLIKSFI